MTELSSLESLINSEVVNEGPVSPVLLLMDVSLFVSVIKLLFFFFSASYALHDKTSQVNRE